MVKTSPCSTSFSLIWNFDGAAQLLGRCADVRLTVGRERELKPKRFFFLGSKQGIDHGEEALTEHAGPYVGPASKSSYFQGDPPPDPRFLASLGALSLAQLQTALTD